MGWLSSTNSDAVRLAWDASECTGDCEPHGVDGYRIHWGSESGIYPNDQDVGNTLEVEVDIPDGSYIVVTGYNSAGSSENSNEILLEFVPAVITQATKFQEATASSYRVGVDYEITFQNGNWVIIHRNLNPGDNVRLEY